MDLSTVRPRSAHRRKTMISTAGTRAFTVPMCTCSRAFPLLSDRKYILAMSARKPRRDGAEHRKVVASVHTKCCSVAASAARWPCAVQILGPERLPAVKNAPLSSANDRSQSPSGTRNLTLQALQTLQAARCAAAPHLFAGRVCRRGRCPRGTPRNTGSRWTGTPARR